MRTIRCATAITLTTKERTVLEALVRSPKTKVRMRDRTRIVLLAANGIATHDIGLVVGCAPRAWHRRGACATRVAVLRS